MAGCGPSVAELLAVLWEMEAEERAEVRAALAREPVGMGVGGGDGSQPMSAITRAGPPKKVWMYIEEGQEHMLEEVWMERLNAAEAQQTYGITFEFQNKWKHGFRVSVDDMAYKNHKSKKEGRLYRMEMIILNVQNMVGEGDKADLDELQQGNAWNLRWQHEDTSGWKNMTLESNKTVLAELVAGKDDVVFTHDWLSPNSGKWMKTIYDVDFVTGLQISRDYGKNQREVRLVAMREVGA